MVPTDPTPVGRLGLVMDDTAPLDVSLAAVAHVATVSAWIVTHVYHHIVTLIFANYVLTTLSNLLNNQNLTDAHTCYKLMKVEVIKKLNLSHEDFSICPEITTKLSRLNYKIIEIPISYRGRNYSEGKKIRFKDAILALHTLIKFRFFWKKIDKN